jgi:ATP-dependent DNA helicase RecG
LDKVQKGKALATDEIKQLRASGLIEGRKPNFYISSHIAKKTGQQGDYMKMRGIDNDYCKKIILDYLEKFSEASRAQFEEALLDKLSDALTVSQKRNKVKNTLQALKKEGLIISKDNIWVTSKSQKLK